MADTSPVSLTLRESGVEIDTWDRYTVTLSMLDPGSPWTFSFWHSVTAQTAWAEVRRRVKLFSEIVVAIDGAPQLNGRVEAFETHGERSGATMLVSGRDLSGPALSWDATPTLGLRGQTLSDALRLLFAPLGIPVEIGVSADGAREVSLRDNNRRSTRSGRGYARPAPTRRSRQVDLAHPKPGEKVWQVAEQITRRLGYLLWVAPSTTGSLAVIVDAPAFGTPPRYEFRREISGVSASGNILSGVERFNVRDVPTEVFLYTGGSRGAGLSARSARAISNRAYQSRTITRGFVDPLTLPSQPRHIHDPRARTAEAAAVAANRVIFDAMRHFRAYELTVQGHRQGGRLYAVNTMARVYDDLASDAEGRPLNEEMLIVRVEFTGSRRDGQTTKLTLVPRESLQLQPETT